MYLSTLDLLKQHFSTRSITQSDIPLISNHFTKETTIQILNDILNNRDLLEKIAQRSYTHALGFDKLVLADLRKDIDPSLPKAQVRLHIWNPENDAVPMVESLHEHSFDFVSVILSGYLENQCFTMNKTLTSDQEWVLRDLKEWVENADKEDIKKFDHSIEVIEAKRLSHLGSAQFDRLYTDHDLIEAVDFITTKTPFKTIETALAYVLGLQGHYVSDRVAGEKKDYKHVLERYVYLHPYDCPTTHEGNAYFHPYQLPHRLFYDNKLLNATILVTTDVPENPKGGSLQRPTYIQKEEQGYKKHPIDPNALKIKLEDMIAILKQGD